MATGNPNEEATKTELLDLNDLDNVCNMPSYSIPLEGATGGLIEFDNPMFCGKDKDINFFGFKIDQNGKNYFPSPLQVDIIMVIITLNAS